MTSVLTDEEVVVDVDMDATVPCMWDPCDREAAWVTQCPACLFQAFGCGPHKRASEAREILMRSLGYFPICSQCNTPWPEGPPPWRPI